MFAAATVNRNSADTSVPIMPPTSLKDFEAAFERGGRNRNGRGRDHHDGRVAEREEEADAERALALLHQLSRHVVDGRDVIRIDRVAQAERIGEERRADEHRIIAERDQRPDPRQYVGADQHRIDAGGLAAEFRALIVECLEYRASHEHSKSRDDAPQCVRHAQSIRPRPRRRKSFVRRIYAIVISAPRPQLVAGPTYFIALPDNEAR